MAKWCIFSFGSHGTMQREIDKFDLRILEILQRDASISTSEVARQVGLSQSPCWKRIHRLEQLGYIEKRVAVLNRKKLGLDIAAFIHVKLSEAGRRLQLGKFEQAIGKMPEVTSCCLVVGEFDFIVQVSVYDIAHLETLLKDGFWAMSGIQEIRTSIILSRSTVVPSLPRRR